MSNDTKNLLLRMKIVLPILYLIGFYFIFRKDTIYGFAILLGATLGLVYLLYIINKYKQNNVPAAKRVSYYVAVTLGLGFSVIGVIQLSSSLKENLIYPLQVLQIIVGLAMLAVGLWNLLYNRK
jgi:hypothetical protein